MILKFLSNFIADIRAEFAMASVERRWRKAGVEAPKFVAAREISHRVTLEDFRNYASDRYTTSGGLIDEIKEGWLTEVWKPMAKTISAEEASLLKSIIEAMPPSEMFHPRAHRAWQAEADSIGRPRGAGRLSRDMMRRALIGGIH